jgi:hypothetical protein
MYDQFNIVPDLSEDWNVSHFYVKISYKHQLIGWINKFNGWKNQLIPWMNQFFERIGISAG